MSKINFLVIAVILAGLFLRLYKIDQPILEYFPERQTQTAEITRNFYLNGWPDFWVTKIRYEKGFPTPLVLELPVYNLIVAGLWKVFGAMIIWGRLVSLTAYVMASTFFALIILKHSNKQSFSLNRKTLFPSLLVFVLSPLHVLASRSFQPDEFALMLLLISIYYSSYFFLMISGFMKLPFYLFGLIFTLKKGGKSLTTFKYLLFFIPISVWSIRASMIMKGEGYAGNYSLLNWFDPLFFLDYSFYVSVFNILHINVLTTLGLLFFTIGLFHSWREKSTDLWKRWLFVSILYIVFFNRHVSTHEYYSLPLLPPLAAFTGAGLVAVFDSIGFKNTASKKFFILLVLLLVIFALIVPSLNKIDAFNLNNINPVLIERYKALF